MPEDELDDFKDAVIDSLEAMVECPVADTQSSAVTFQKPSAAALQIAPRRRLDDEAWRLYGFQVVFWCAKEWVETGLRGSRGYVSRVFWKVTRTPHSSALE